MTSNMSLPFEQGREVPIAALDEEDMFIRGPGIDHANNCAQHVFFSFQFPETQATTPSQNYLLTIQHDQSAFEFPEFDLPSDLADLFLDVQGIELENPPSTPSTASILETLRTPSSGSSSSAGKITGSGSDSSPTRADLLVFF